MTEIKYQTPEELLMTPQELLEHKLKGLKSKVEVREAQEAREIVYSTNPIADLDRPARDIEQHIRVKEGLRKLAQKWEGERIIYQTKDLTK